MEHRGGKLPFVPAPWEDSFPLSPRAPTPFPLGQLLPLSLPLAVLGIFSAFWSWLCKCFHSIPVFPAPCRRGAVGPDESPFSPYMARPFAVQPGRLYGGAVWRAQAFVDTGHRGPPQDSGPDGVWEPALGARLSPPPGGWEGRLTLLTPYCLFGTWCWVSPSSSSWRS